MRRELLLIIRINKNIEEYKDDFWKGLTFQQTIFSGVTVVLGTGSFFIANLTIGLPQMVSIYVAILFALPCALMGFKKIHGMTILQYLHCKKKVMNTPLLIYQSEKSVCIPSVQEQDPIKKEKKDKKEKVLFETPPADMVKEAERWCA